MVCTKYGHLCHCCNAGARQPHGWQERSSQKVLCCWLKVETERSRRPRRITVSAAPSVHDERWICRDRHRGIARGRCARSAARYHKVICFQCVMKNSTERCRCRGRPPEVSFRYRPSSNRLRPATTNLRQRLPGGRSAHASGLVPLGAISAAGCAKGPHSCAVARPKPRRSPGAGARDGQSVPCPCPH